MKKIILTVEITGLEGWDIDFEDQKESKEELEKVISQARRVIAENMGIGYLYTKVTGKFENS